MKRKVKNTRDKSLGDLISRLMFLEQLHFPVAMSERVWDRNVRPLLEEKELVRKQINEIAGKLSRLNESKT